MRISWICSSRKSSTKSIKEEDNKEIDPMVSPLDTPKSKDKNDELKGFNVVWKKLPHISWYQVRLSVLGGYCCFISGLWATYPNFAQYKPPTRCKTVFDQPKP